MLSETDILNIEKKFLHESKLVLVLNKVNGTVVEGLFTSKEKANQYIVRECINLSITEYSEAEIDEKMDFKDSFSDIIHDYLYFYELVDIGYLDSSKPIYVIQNGNYQVFGDTFLTNDIDYWKSKNKFDLGGKDWINQCIVKIDRELSSLNLSELKNVEKVEKKEQ
jgi:hypothetical protein